MCMDKKNSSSVEDLRSQPGVHDVDNKEVVILIVGSRKGDRSGVVESLKTGTGWVDNSTNGVGIFTRKSPARVIVDTTELKNVQDKSPSAIARRWISRNSLRRIIFEKFVVVVCVFASEERNKCKWDTFSNSNCWVDVFGLIFNNHKAEILMLVKTEGEHELSPATTSEVEQFVHNHGFSTKNIKYSHLKGVLSGAIEDSISQRKRYPRQSTVMPFYLGDVPSDRERYGLWSPERVILFGKSGSGKSTLAQMLTIGKLDPDNKTFEPHPGIRGGTKKMKPGEGRGWYVLDTPGFGEPKDRGSTIPTREVESMIKKYVRMVEGTFSHYLYVFRKDRLDSLDEKLWEFFVLLFGDDIMQQFTVVVAGADEAWIRENRGSLEAHFIGCTSFLSADFPAISTDEGLEEAYEEMRRESLLELENGLAKKNRFDRRCRYGKHSKMQLVLEKTWTDIDLNIEKNFRIQYLVRGADMIFSCCNFSLGSFAELTNALRVDDRIVLMPL